MTRIVIFVILIMICRESHLASIWLLFTMLIAQSCYLWQEWKFPKFDCKILKCLNWTNELFLTLFMLFFIGFRRYTDYQTSSIRSIAILMILLNTGAVLLLQLFSVFYTLIQLCSPRKESSSNADQQSQDSSQRERQEQYVLEEQTVEVGGREKKKESSPRNNEEKKKEVEIQGKENINKKGKKRKNDKTKIKESVNEIQNKMNTKSNFYMDDQEIHEENNTSD